MKITTGYTSIYYDNAEFSVSTATTNYNVASNQSNTFGGSTSNAGKPVDYISIGTDETITVKLNSTSNDSITIASSDSPFVLDSIISVTNLFISNASGNTANIKLLLADGKK